jgi:hypothetical protein
VFHAAVKRGLNIVSARRVTSIGGMRRIRGIYVYDWYDDDIFGTLGLYASSFALSGIES